MYRVDTGQYTRLFIIIRKYLFQLTLNAIFSFYFLSDLNKPMTQYPNEGKKGNK